MRPRAPIRNPEGVRFRCLVIGGEPFKTMIKRHFMNEYSTSIFIHPRKGIAIWQEDGGEDQLIVFNSRSRAVEVANAILELAKVATFQGEGE